MNIFYLDSDSQKCAEYHCDKHVVKMILEYTQLLCTAHRVLHGVLMDKKYIMLDEEREFKLYKATHINHPCSIWTRSCYNSYIYVFNLLKFLHKEYEKRYNKVHKSKELLNILKFIPEELTIDDKKHLIVDVPLVMPEQYKTIDSVQSYRNFYIGEKMKFAKWKYSNKPYWLKEL